MPLTTKEGRVYFAALRAEVVKLASKMQMGTLTEETAHGEPESHRLYLFGAGAEIHVRLLKTFKPRADYLEALPPAPSKGSFESAVVEDETTLPSPPPYHVRNQSDPRARR